MNNPIAVVTGGTGLLGQSLIVSLVLKGYHVRVLTRDVARAKQSICLPVEWVPWDPNASIAPVASLDGVDCVIHLAGEPVAGTRWTAARKSKIYTSRVIGTQNLRRGIQATTVPPRVVVSASAIGFYGDTQDQYLTETAANGDTFLARVCQEWEADIAGIHSLTRLVTLRTGIVLDTQGGALAAMLPIFRLGLGAPLASGTQWMSWIHIDDVVGLIHHAITNESVTGPVNAVAPNPVQNRGFSRVLGRAVGRWTGPAVPRGMIRLLLGQMADIVLHSQRCVPSVAKATGYRFKYEHLDDALRDLIRPLGFNAYTLRRHQWIEKPVSTVFPFFSDAKNLETITPPWVGFTIKSVSGPMAVGTLIDYRIVIKGVPMKWRTRISKWEPNQKFADEMVWGPYQRWHHTHTFQALKSGTLMTDLVIYQPPFGVLGDIVALLMITKDVAKIFNYRTQQINRLF